MLPGVAARFRILWSEILAIVDLRRPLQFQEPGLRRNHNFCFLILNTNFRSCETLLVILCDVEKKPKVEMWPSFHSPCNYNHQNNTGANNRGIKQYGYSIIM